MQRFCCQKFQYFADENVEYFSVKNGKVCSEFAFAIMSDINRVLSIKTRFEKIGRRCREVSRDFINSSTKPKQCVKDFILA